MTNTDTPSPIMTHAERLAKYSAARLDTPPIMPAVVNRPAPRERNRSRRRRTIR